MNRKAVSGTTLILLLAITLISAFNTEAAKAEPKTWTVDDDGPADFHTIQEAIDAPEVIDGDTIFVREGIYHENILVDEKSFLLIGEDKATTIIDGNRTESTHLIELVGVNTAVISGFTIRNAEGYGHGIFLLGCGQIEIEDNILEDCYWGIDIAHAGGIRVAGNDITTDIAWEHSWGIGTYDVLKMEILDNVITGFAGGIWASGRSFILRNNKIADSTYLAIGLHSDNSVVSRNWIINNQIEIQTGWGGGNRIFHNTFINNTIQVENEGVSNIWDDEYPCGGNYWSEHSGADLHCGPSQDILGRDGIWDHPYVIDENNTDNYPLVNPYVLGNLSVSLYTDKYTYHAGEIMHLGLNVTNPDSVKYLCFAIWCELPDSSTYLYMHEHSVILPIGFTYTNPSFSVFTLPSLPSGNYTWHAAFLERETHAIIVEDTAEWQFS